MARKGKFEYWLTDEGLTLISGWAKDGLSDEDISHNMGINRSTLHEWKKLFPPISNALKVNKEIADRIIENALYKRARGYKVEETRVEIMPDGTKRGFQITKEVPPDVTACIYWLKNRKPQEWRDRPEKDHVDTEDSESYFEEAGIQ